MEVMGIVKRTMVESVEIRLTPEELLAVAAAFGSASHDQRKRALIARDARNIRTLNGDFEERALYDKLNEAVMDVSKTIGGS
jgi:hypothetical protein